VQALSLACYAWLAFSGLVRDQIQHCIPPTSSSISGEMSNLQSSIEAYHSFMDDIFALLIPVWGIFEKAFGQVEFLLHFGPDALHGKVLDVVRLEKGDNGSFKGTGEGSIGRNGGIVF